MNDYIKHLIGFTVFSSIILFIIFISLKILLKKFKFNTKKSKLYGMISSLDNKSILAFSFSTLNYLFLVYNMMMIVDLNFLYISIIIISSLMPSILIKDYIKIPLSFIVSLINVFAIYLLGFVHNYLVGEVSDILMRISIFFVIAFTFIYFSYNYINDINDIVQKNKLIKRRRKSSAN